MYRCWIEFIEKGEHRLYYGNGRKKIFAENVVHELVPHIGDGFADMENGVRDVLGYSQVDHGPSWLDIWIDEWIRVYEKDGKVEKICTIHVQKVERTPENTNADSVDCDIDHVEGAKTSEGA